MLHQQSAYAKKGNAGLVPIVTSGDKICGGVLFNEGVVERHIVT
jgi:hypothetical protein